MRASASVSVPGIAGEGSCGYPRAGGEVVDGGFYVMATLFNFISLANVQPIVRSLSMNHLDLSSLSLVSTTPKSFSPPKCFGLLMVGLAVSGAS